jgi:hypothetical protein
MGRAGSLQTQQHAAALAALLRPTAAELIGQTVEGMDRLTAMGDRLARTLDRSLCDEIAAQAEGIRRTALRARVALENEGGAANDRP